MTDNYGSRYAPLPDEWVAQFEKAEALAKQYMAKTGHPGGNTVHQLAMAAVKGAYPTEELRRSGDWSWFFPGYRDQSDSARAEWDTAEEARLRQLARLRELRDQNTKAEVDRVKAREAEEQERRDAELADVTAELRHRYLQTPGGTPETFAAALPQLLEDHRRQLVRDRQTADDEAMAAHAVAFRI